MIAQYRAGSIDNEKTRGRFYSLFGMMLQVLVKMGVQFIFMPVAVNMHKVIDLKQCCIF